MRDVLENPLPPWRETVVAVALVRARARAMAGSRDIVAELGVGRVYQVVFWVMVWRRVEMEHLQHWRVLKVGNGQKI